MKISSYEILDSFEKTMYIRSINNQEMDGNSETLIGIGSVAILLMAVIVVIGIYLCFKKSCSKKQYLFFNSNPITKQDLTNLKMKYDIAISENNLSIDRQNAEIITNIINMHDWIDLIQNTSFTIAELNDTYMKFYPHKFINANLFGAYKCKYDNNFILVEVKNLCQKIHVADIVIKTIDSVLNNKQIQNSPSGDIVNEIRIEPEMLYFMKKFDNMNLENLLRKHNSRNTLHYKFEGKNSDKSSEDFATYIQNKSKIITFKTITLPNGKNNKDKGFTNDSFNMPLDYQYICLQNFDGSLIVGAEEQFIDKVINEIKSAKEAKLIDLEDNSKKKKEKKTHKFEFSLNNESKSLDSSSNFIPIPIVAPLTQNTKYIENKNEYIFPNGLQVQIVLNDLINEKCDAIVNPSNNQLKHNGGASKAIARAAGSTLSDECYKHISTYGKLDDGAAIVTTAGNLSPAIRNVIHVVVPYYKEQNSISKLSQAVENVFSLAYEYKYKVISIPAIGSGLSGFSKEIVADIFLKTFFWFDRQKKTYVMTIRLVNYDDETTISFKKYFEKNYSNMAISSATDINTNSINKSDKNISSYLYDENIRSSLNMPNRPAKIDQTQQDKQLETCTICLDDITDPMKLDCGHIFCKDCIENSFKQFQPKCPSCNKLFGALKGNQPYGTMKSFEDFSLHLPGYEGYNAFHITYTIPDGIQDDRHPNPGTPYHGTKRHAYLPANKEGKMILELLKKAFDANLIFTVGVSSTTAKDNQVIWNDIHHKTSVDGAHGYPDDDYLRRVKEELSSKGITN